MSRPGFLRKYGFAFILLAIWIISISAYWGTSSSQVEAEAKFECEVKSLIISGGEDDKVLNWRQCLDPSDRSDRFWDGFWENHQSEYAQLLLQFLGMVVFARYIAYKEQEDMDELKRLVSDLHGKFVRGGK